MVTNQNQMIQQIWEIFLIMQMIKNQSIQSGINKFGGIWIIIKDLNKGMSNNQQAPVNNNNQEAPVDNNNQQAPVQNNEEAQGNNNQEVAEENNSESHQEQKDNENLGNVNQKNDDVNNDNEQQNGNNEQQNDHNEQQNAPAPVNNEMQLQNQQQQQQQQQPIQQQIQANNDHNAPIEQQHPQQQHRQQQQQGELPESIHNQQQQQQHQSNKNLQQSKDKDSYINRLQIYLNKVKTDLNNKSHQYQQLTQDNKKTKQTLKKIRFDFLSSKQQLSTLNQQKSQLQKQKQILTKSNTHLNQQLQTYKQAGDINFYKNKIVQLQKLLQIQKKQLQMKSTMIDQKDQLESFLKGSDKNKIQILKLIEKYETQNRTLAQKHAQITLINTQLQNTNKSQQLMIQQLKITSAQNVSILALEKQKTFQLQQQLKNNEHQFQKKLKQLEENLQQLIASKQNQKLSDQSLTFPSKNIIKSPQELYGIKILTPIEERNLIMREYIDLQIRHQSLTQELNNLRERHYNTLRQTKNIAATHVPKKDFSQLYKKYAKLRKCLQSSLINEENLRKELLRVTQNNDLNISEENAAQNLSKGQAQSQAFSKYKSLVLQEPQNQVNKIEKIIQKSTDSQKQLFTMKQQLQTKQKLIRTQKLIKQKDQKIIYLQKQNQKSKNFIQLYDTELTYKNNGIQLLRKAYQQTLEKIFNLEKNSISKAEQQYLNALIEQNKMVNQILQIKNIQALKQNAILKSEKQNLTELYNDLKNMYEDLLSREPQSQSQQQQRHEEKQRSAMEIEHNKPCKQCLERQQKLKSLTFSQVQTQTEGLPEIYFKQIKELLTVLRKFPKKVDNITGVLQTEKSTIHEVKKRYDQVMEAYGAKYRQLEQEKKSNDQWRLKQKDQIRQQFQEIREMLLNERLITALRKAKSLIEYYEQNAPEVEGEQNIEEGEEQEGNQKPNPEAQPIEEQKQKA